MSELAREKRNAKKAAAVAVAATLAAGGAAVTLDNDKGFENSFSTNAVVQDIDEMNAAYNPDSIETSGVRAEQENSLAYNIARIVAIPIYAVGSFLMHMAGIVTSSVMAPVLMIIFKWVLLAAVIIGSLALTFKIAFPDIPLGKVLNRKSIAFILCSVTLVSIICEVVPVFWPDATVWVNVFRIAGGLAIFAPVAYTALRFYKKVKAH